MAENEVGTPPPFIKQEHDSPDDPPQNGDGHCMKGTSISERRAGTSGFNADAVRLTNVRPYVTIPSGLSPSALLDSSMVLLPNAQAPLSPTTGTFHQFSTSPDHENLKLKLKLAGEEDGEDDPIEPDRPEHHSTSDEFTIDNLTFEEYFEFPKAEFQEIAKSDQQPNENTQSNNNNHPSYQEIKNLPPKIAYSPNKHSEDGFYWRKYGQKHVKGSEFPRSYYKCTNANCLVKKKVERSHAGEVTEIVYKGNHNHPQPNPLNNRRPNETSSEEGACFKAEGATFETDHQWIPDHSGFGSPSILGGFPDSNTHIVQSFDSPSFEATTQDFSPNTVNSQDGDDRNQVSPDSNSFKEEDDENNNTENEQKKRKRENANLNLQQNETVIPRMGRESKVVVQIESDVDILDDGYRWRKYGQKVVKGNPNPRSYYKCTTPRCPVRKHVERAADDIKSVLTTYEGKHNHDVPASKTGTLAISDASNQLQQTVANNIGSNSSPMVQKLDYSKAAKQVQDNLHLYTERKPILSYNDFMRSNLSGNFTGNHHDGFGASQSPSVFPYSFSPFPSLTYNSLLLNGSSNMMKPYSPPSKFYQMMPSDYMSMAPQMSHQISGGIRAPSMGTGGFGFNSYTGLQNTTRAVQGDQIRECQVASVVKPKEEQMGDEGEPYDHACLSTANRGNGSL